MPNTNWCFIKKYKTVFLISYFATPSPIRALSSMLDDTKTTLKEETFADKNFTVRLQRKIFTFCGHKLLRMTSLEDFHEKKTSTCASLSPDANPACKTSVSRPVLWIRKFCLSKKKKTLDLQIFRQIMKTIKKLEWITIVQHAAIFC